MSNRFKVKIDNSSHTYNGNNKYMVLDTETNLVAYNMIFDWAAELLYLVNIDTYSFGNAHEYIQDTEKEMSLEELVILKGK